MQTHDLAPLGDPAEEILVPVQPPFVQLAAVPVVDEAPLEPAGSDD